MIEEKDKLFLSNKDCRKILEFTYDVDHSVVALFNIGHMVSNSIIIAGQMIADAIRSNKINDSPITRNKI